MKLSLEFVDNGTLHGDLVLCMDGDSWICDSYYLALDGEVLADREDAGKVRVVLRTLLESWLSLVTSLRDGETGYLPYDFSDQYTAWLRCTRENEDVVIARGWAPLEGYTFFPSQPGTLMTHLSGFRVDGPTTRGTLQQVVEAIGESIARVA